MRDRLETDRLRLEVVPAPEDVGDFQVLVFVDDVEMTVKGAGLGMDPYDVLVPENRLVAGVEPRTVPIARCGCGVYGCDSTDVTIRRAGGVVHWDWEIEVPMRRGVTFPIAAYDAEVARAGSDHTWETPERRAGRLVLERADREVLAAHGLSIQWMADDFRDRSTFQACLGLGNRYQVFVRVPWDGRSADELADAVVAELRRAPQTWTAEWFPNQPGLDEPPLFAGRGWRRHRT